MKNKTFPVYYKDFGESKIEKPNIFYNIYKNISPNTFSKRKQATKIRKIRNLG